MPANPDTKDYIPCYLIYLKLKKWWNYGYRDQYTNYPQELLTEKGPGEPSWGGGHNL